MDNLKTMPAASDIKAAVPRYHLVAVIENCNDHDQLSFVFCCLCADKRSVLHPELLECGSIFALYK